MPDNILLLAVVVIAAIVILVLFRRLGEMRAPRPIPSETPPRARSIAGVPDETSTRVAVTHPIIRKAAERALKEGGDITRFVHREGDTIYFIFDALPDPEQRRRAAEMLRRVQSGEESADVMDMAELMALLRQMLGK